jgi:glucokinase
MVVLGPGSGLGVAGLVSTGDKSVVVASEGGHATMPASSNQEERVLDLLRRRFGHVSAERVLSGPGIENLYEALATLEEVDVPQRNAADITMAALKGTCPTSRAALEMFCAMLGGFAGNVALTYGARGGVYIAIHLTGFRFCLSRDRVACPACRKRPSTGRHRVPLVDHEHRRLHGVGANRFRDFHAARRRCPSLK